MGESRGAEHILQHGGDAGVDRGGGIVVGPRFLHGLVGVEDGKLGVVAVAKGDKTQVGKFLFLAVGKHDFNRAFGGHARRIGAKRLDGKSDDDAAFRQAALKAANIGEPAAGGVGADQDSTQRPGGASPKVFFSIGTSDIFAENKSRRLGTV